MKDLLDVLHCDNHLLVVVKPACVPAVPDDSGDTSLFDLAKDWVKREYKKPGDVFLGVVQRLDRPVSGVLVFARTSKGAARLSEQFRDRRVSKTYWGVVAGRPRGRGGRLEQWLVKDSARNMVRSGPESTSGARRAVTRWRVLREAGGRTLVELEPLTGRPHQLRVACAALGTPLLGDLKYGAKDALPDRSVALHARRLELEHPTRKERMSFEAPVPEIGDWAIARRS